MKKLVFGWSIVVGLVLAVACADASSKLTTRQMATSASAPAVVPGSGSAGISDAVARADHSHACTAASASTGGCLTTDAQTIAGVKTFASDPTLGTGTGVVFADGTRQVTAAETASTFARTMGRWVLQNPAATNFTGVDNGNLALSVSGARTKDVVGGRMYIRHSTSLLENSLASSQFTGFKVAAARITLNVHVRIQDTAGSGAYRLWGAWIAQNGPVGNNIAPRTETRSGLNTTFLGLGFESGAGAVWMCCAGVGLQTSCVSTGVAVAADTTYDLTVDSNGTASCEVNGSRVSVTALTPFPDGTISVGIGAGIQALEATDVANSFLLGRAFWTAAD